MARGNYFLKLRLEEYHKEASIRQRFRTVHATGYRSVQERV